MRTDTVIYHRGDYDGIFCREIAKMSLLDATCIGWDHGDVPLKFPETGRVFVFDLPLDTVFGSSIPYDYETRWPRLVWIDHHKTAIAKTNPGVPGFRIEGVAACRLAWNWFLRTSGGQHVSTRLPTLEAFTQRHVREPLAVTLAGEYDVWDHRGDGDIEFQLGLDAQECIQWDTLLSGPGNVNSDIYLSDLIHQGAAIKGWKRKHDQRLAERAAFEVQFAGLKFLALNATGGSQVIEGTETDADAYLTFLFTGRVWQVRLYGREGHEHDLSKIAVAFGGGGHAHACGFECAQLPDFLKPQKPGCCGDCQSWYPEASRNYLQGACGNHRSGQFGAHVTTDDGCGYHRPVLAQ